MMVITRVKAIWWEKEKYLPKSGVRIIGYPTEIKKLTLPPYTICRNINVWWIMKLNIRVRKTQFIEYNIGENLWDLGLDKDFLRDIESINCTFLCRKLGFMKIKNLGSSEKKRNFIKKINYLHTGREYLKHYYLKKDFYWKYISNTCNSIIKKQICQFSKIEEELN